MKHYRVLVTRTAYAHRELMVQAESMAEAINVALDSAGGFEFSEKESEYSAEDAVEVQNA